MLHFIDTGAGQEAVLLLHGLGSRGADWQPQIEALAGSYRVIAPDLRGHGRSPAPPGAWQMRDLADDVQRLLASLGLRRCHVVGFSLGGMVALELAARAPHSIHSLTLINSQPFPGPRPRALLLAYWLRRGVIRLLGLRTMAGIIANKLFPDPAQAALRQRFIAGMAAMSPRAYLRALDAIFHWQYTLRAEHMRMPIQILAADQDYTPLAAKQSFADRLPHCALKVIPNSRHASTIDQAGLVNSLLLSFLAAYTKTET